jgi:hypothetical protein
VPTFPALFLGPAGRVVEEGTHDELMVVKGLYHQLVHAHEHQQEEEVRLRILSKPNDRRSGFCPSLM